MTLEVMEFLRRFLQHVLPKGFHRVRAYGLLHPGNRELLHRLQLHLDVPTASADADSPTTQQPPSAEHIIAMPCPVCGQGFLLPLIRPVTKSAHVLEQPTHPAPRAPP